MCQPGAATACTAGSQFYAPIVELPPLRAASEASAINEAGEVVGNDYDAWPAVTNTRAVKYPAAGGVVAVAPAFAGSSAFGVNAAGVVVGGTGPGNPPFTETVEGVVSTTPYPDFGPTVPTAINDDGEFTGSHYPPRPAASAWRRRSSTRQSPAAGSWAPCWGRNSVALAPAWPSTGCSG